MDTLIILGGNPAYDAPANLEFSNLLLGGKVNLRIHLGLYDDETARLCNWHIPEAHVLESWGDVRAFDGTATIQQPLIAPLYGGKTAVEVLALLLGEPGRYGPGDGARLLASPEPAGRLRDRPGASRSARV